MKNDSFEKQYKGKGLASQRQYPNEHLIGFMQQFPSDARVLEIGCGSGANLWYLAKNFDAYGTDHSETGLKLCGETLTKWGVSAELLQCDMTEITFGTRFDAIVDVVSMQHLGMADHEVAYATIYARLKNGGKFFSYHLGTNSTIFLHGGGKRKGNTLDNVMDETMPLHGNGLMTFLSPLDADKMLQSAGFSNINIETVTRTYQNQKQRIEYLIISAEKP